MQYRKEVDGLRALAVVPVILFHAGFSLFSGGFIGVDIFFVISGYLITSIIINDIENNNFSLLNFYERRTRRILPALFTVIFCSLPFAWLWMLPDQFVNFSRSLVAVSIFSSNLFFWKTSDYFDTAATEAEKPFLHTWSLAVEEQFYLLFPLFLLLFWRLGRNRLFWLLIIATVCSLLLSEWLWRIKPSTNFYLLPTRAWELLLGCLAAFYIKQNGLKSHNLLAWLGLSSILFAIFSFDRTTPSPSVYTLIPVAGTFLLIVFGSGTAVASLLSKPLMVGVGLISYSAYLWHQPLLAFARIRFLDITPVFMAFICLLSLAVGYLSWKYIEQPFRTPAPLIRSRGLLFSTCLGCTILVIAFGIYGYQNSGVPQRLTHELFKLAEFKKGSNPYSKYCVIPEGRRNVQHPLPGCTDFFVNDQAQVMFVGDSHSVAITHQAQKFLQSENIGSYAVSYYGCIGLRGFYRVDKKSNHYCDDYNREMIDYARETGISTIVITSRYTMYYWGRLFNNGEGGDEGLDITPINPLEQRGKHEHFASDIRKESVLEKMNASIEELAREFNVVLVYPIPEVGWNVLGRLAKCHLSEREDCLQISTPFHKYTERVAPITQLFDKLDSPNIYRVKTGEIFCNRDIQGRCIATKDSIPLYLDDDHLADKTGAKMLAPLVLEAVKDSLVDKTASR